MLARLLSDQPENSQLPQPFLVIISAFTPREIPTIRHVDLVHVTTAAPRVSLVCVVDPDTGQLLT